MAAQEQPLSRSIGEGINPNHRSQDCAKVPQRLSSTCKMQLAQSTPSHNQKSGIVVSKWQLLIHIWQHLFHIWIRNFQAVMGDGTKNGWEQKILWDLKFQTDKQLVANQSETVVTDKQQKISSSLDVESQLTGAEVEGKAQRGHKSCQELKFNKNPGTSKFGCVSNNMSNTKHNIKPPFTRKVLIL